MNPKKATDYIPEEAARQGIPKDDLEDMISGYYKVVKYNMENFGSKGSTQEAINIAGIGRVRVSVKKLEKGIEKLEKLVWLKKNRRHPPVEKVTEMGKMKRCLKLHKNEVWEKKKVQKIRKQVRDEAGRKTTEDMGEQGTDS